jgi:hypothetical protein
VHIRRGDAGARKLSDEYYLGAMWALRDVFYSALAKLTGKSRIHFWIHTNSVNALGSDFLRQNDTTILQSPMRTTTDSVGREAETKEMIRHFLNADALVLSRSSLSFSLAMLANKTSTIFPACETDRPLARFGWQPFDCHPVLPRNK